MSNCVEQSLKTSDTSVNQAVNNINVDYVDTMLNNRTLSVSDYINENIDFSNAWNSDNIVSVGNYNCLLFQNKNEKSIIVFDNQDYQLNNNINYSLSDELSKLPLGVHYSLTSAQNFLDKLPAFISSFKKCNDDSFEFVIDDYRKDISNYRDNYDTLIIVYNDNNIIGHIIPIFINEEESKVVTKYIENGNLKLLNKRRLIYRASLSGMSGANKIRILSSSSFEKYYLQVFIPSNIDGGDDYGRKIDLSKYYFLISNSIFVDTKINKNLVSPIYENLIIKNNSISEKDDSYFISKMSPVVTEIEYKPVLNQYDSTDFSITNNTTVAFSSRNYKIRWKVLSYDDPTNSAFQKMGVALTMINTNAGGQYNQVIDDYKEQVLSFVEGSEVERTKADEFNLSLEKIYNSYFIKYEAILKVPTLEHIESDPFRERDINIRFFTRKDGNENWQASLLSAKINQAKNSYQIVIQHSNKITIMEWDAIDLPLPKVSADNFDNHWWGISQLPGYSGSGASHNNTLFSVNSNYWALDFGGNGNNWFKLKDQTSIWNTIVNSYNIGLSHTVDDEKIPILSSKRGIIQIKNFMANGYGNYYVIEHLNGQAQEMQKCITDGYISIYAHLDSNQLPVINIPIYSEKGRYLGLMGNSGTRDLHLHWGLAFNQYSLMGNNGLVRYYHVCGKNINGYFVPDIRENPGVQYALIYARDVGDPNDTTYYIRDIRSFNQIASNCDRIGERNVVYSSNRVK